MMSSNIFACSTTSDNMSRKIDDEPCCYKRNTIPIWNSWNKYQCQNCGLFYYIIFTGLVRWWNKYVCQRLLNYAKEFFISNYFILVHHVTNCCNFVVYCIILLLCNYYPILPMIMTSCLIAIFPEYRDFSFYSYYWVVKLKFLWFYIISFLWLYCTSWGELKDICNLKRITFIR